MTNAQPNLAETLAQQKAEDEAGRFAAANPLPGPLRVAFAPCQEIDVLGRYKVRQLCDYDVKLLEMLSHPLAPQIYGAFEGKEFSYTDMTGPSAWQLSFILTRPAVDVMDLVESKGLGHIKLLAQREFGVYGMSEQMELFRAAAIQIPQYWSTVVGHVQKESEDAKATPPFSSVAK